MEIAQAAFPGCTVREAASMRAGIAQVAARDYDVALIDLGLSDGSGMEVLRNLRLLKPETVCVVTTVMGDDASIVVPCPRARRATRSRTSQSISSSPSSGRWRRVSRRFRPRSLAASWSISAIPARRHLRTTSRRASARCWGWGWSGRGLRNGEVAAELGLSENTVADYIKTIYRKLGISSRAEASWHATRMGLGGPSD